MFQTENFNLKIAKNIDLGTQVREITESFLLELKGRILEKLLEEGYNENLELYSSIERIVNTNSKLLLTESLLEKEEEIVKIYERL